MLKWWQYSFSVGVVVAVERRKPNWVDMAEADGDDVAGGGSIYGF